MNIISSMLVAFLTLAALLQGIVALRDLIRRAGHPKIWLISTAVCIVLAVISGYVSYGSSSRSDTPPSPSSNTTTPSTISRPTLIPSLTPTPKVIPTPTPKVIPENLNIPCIGCQGGDYALTLKVDIITIDYANQQTIMKYTIKNIGSNSCETYVYKLQLQDDNGAVFKAQGVPQDIGSIGAGNPFIVNSIFDLLPRPNIHYLLSTTLVCAEYFDYKTEDFVFN